ncbi:MAG: hypothetical protein V1738_00360 [Patescibacteria group bacterium]
MTLLRALITMIPYVGGSIDILLYKKGHDTERFQAGEDLYEGDNCYLNSADGKFYKASAISDKTASTMIVKALQTIKANKKGVFLVKGKYYSNNHKRGTLYLSLESGKLTTDVNYGTDNVVRIIATALNEKEEYFAPSATWMTIA